MRSLDLTRHTHAPRPSSPPRHRSPMPTPRGVAAPGRTRCRSAARLGLLTALLISLVAVTAGSWGRAPAAAHAASGEVGNNSTSYSHIPAPVQLPSGVTARSVSAGERHSLAVGSDGHVYAWGDNSSGELGTGSTTDSDSPAPVQLPGGVSARSISAGNYYSLAVGSDGHVYAWGRNDDGELGNNSTTASAIPVSVQLPSGVTALSISAGSSDSLAVGSDGHVYAWGENLHGQLGTGSFGQVGTGSRTGSSTPVPVQLPGGVSARSVSAGDYHSLALGSDGHVYAWGANTNGELGAHARLTGASTPNSWSPTGSMRLQEWGGTALVLPDGRVLVLGDTGGQVYDPRGGTWTLTAPGPSHTDSAGDAFVAGYTVTLLGNGNVLVTGGATDGDPSSAMPCNPATAGAASSTSPGIPAAGAAPRIAGLPSSGTTIRLRPSRMVGLRPHAAPHIPPPPPPIPLCTADLYDPGTNTWTPTGTMASGRLGHTATLLLNRQVLVAGGDSSCDVSGCTTTATAELYDPRTGRWATTGSMHTPHTGHSAIRLADGRVLVLQPGATPDAEVYDPRTGRWTVTHGLTMVRSRYSETLLPDGRVLVAGGSAGSDSHSLPTATAELYTPRSGRWSPTGSMFHARTAHTATLLPNGQVLVAGGDSSCNVSGCTTATATAELYNPRTGSWSLAPTMTIARAGAVAALLASGRVLVAGGGTGTGRSEPASAELYTPALTPRSDVRRHHPNDVPLASAELRGPLPASCASPAPAATETAGPVVRPRVWRLTMPMSTARTHQTATLLRDGRVLVVGGQTPFNGVVATAELYDPTTGQWGMTGPMTAPRAGQTATLLPDGRVLVAGGFNDSAPSGTALAAAELYDPATRSWRPTAGMSSGRWGQTATLLRDGTVLVAGGFFGAASPAQALASAEIYDPATGQWRGAMPMAVARGNHTATLLRDGRVLVAGGGSALAELYDPASGQWRGAGRMSTNRYGHTATLLRDGRVLVAGGFAHGAVASTEIYNPTTGRWAAAGQLATARFDHTAALLPDGRALIVGGARDNGPAGALRSAEVFDPAHQRWQGGPSLRVARARYTTTTLRDGTLLVTGGVGYGPTYYLASAEILTP